MRQAVVGACLGAACCVLALALFGAVTGFLHGAGANGQHPPGLYAALLNTATMAMFLGPVAAAVGAVVGGGVGLGMAIGAKGRSVRPSRGGTDEVDPA